MQKTETIPTRFILLLEVLLGLFVIGAFVSIVILQVAAILLVPAGLYALIKYRKFFPDRILTIAVSAFLLSGALSIFISPEPAKALPVFMHHIVLWSVIPVIFTFLFSTRINSRNIAAALTILALMSSIAGVYRHFAGAERTYGFTGGYFTLAALVVFTLPVTIGWASNQSRGKFALALLSSILQIAVLWWTYTRSAFLAVIVGFSLAAIILMIRFRKKWTKGIALRICAHLLPIIVLITLILVSSDSRINPLSQTTNTTAESIDLSSGRNEIIRDATIILSRSVKENEWGRVIFGYGLASRKILVNSIFRSWESDYLEALMNQGIIGLLILLTIYWKFLLLVKRYFFRPEHPVAFGYAVSGLGFWLMSFLTVQLLGIYNPAFFAILYGALSEKTPELA